MSENQTEKRLKGLVGLCVRARQTVFGQDACLKALREGSCGVLLVSEEASDNTRQRYEQACRQSGALLARVPAGFLEEATGRSGVALALKPGGLAEQISHLLSEQADRE